MARVGRLHADAPTLISSNLSASRLAEDDDVLPIRFATADRQRRQNVGFKMASVPGRSSREQLGYLLSAGRVPSKLKRASPWVRSDASSINRLNIKRRGNRDLLPC